MRLRPGETVAVCRRQPTGQAQHPPPRVWHLQRTEPPEEKPGSGPDIVKGSSRIISKPHSRTQREPAGGAVIIRSAAKGRFQFPARCGHQQLYHHPRATSELRRGPAGCGGAMGRAVRQRELRVRRDEAVHSAHGRDTVRCAVEAEAVVP